VTDSFDKEPKAKTFAVFWFWEASECEIWLMSEKKDSDGLLTV
tara:strand:- start:219 stop:347 length:129 start_codon:yes stop_codon:yes gene_type:complete